MASDLFYCGRADAIVGLIANPLRYCANGPREYHEYMTGYHSVSKNERPSREELVKRLKIFEKDERK